MTQPSVLFIGYDLDPALAGRGGVAVYQRSLAHALAEAGCTVTLFLGSRHTVARRPRLRWGERDGLRLVELIDSPLRHCDHHAHPWSHLSDAAVEELTRQVLAAVRPDLVHLHDARLHPSSIVDVALGAGVPVIKTIHNYFDVCPQGELMVGGREPCTDDQNGHRCGECLASFPALNPLKEDLAGSLRGTALHSGLRAAYRFLRRQRDRGGRNRPLLKMATGSEPSATPRRLPYAPVHYLERRRVMVQRLESMAAVHCYSRRSRQILVERGGLDPNRVRVITVSSALLDLISPKPLRDASLPVVFGYLTGAAHSKGLQVLLQAFERLPRDRARLIVHGIDDPHAMSERYPGVQFRRPYDPYARIDDVMGEIDVGVVPSVFEEPFGLAGLEFRAARIPVIASEIGGIPEWLEPGKTGDFVPPGDPAALCELMGRYVKRPEWIAERQETITPWKTLAEHAAEMLALYEDVL